jgi:hypothetical protein
MLIYHIIYHQLPYQGIIITALESKIAIINFT